MSSLQLLLLSMINFVIRCWESQYTVVTALLGIYKFGPFPYWSSCHSANPLFPQLLLAQSGSSLSSVLRLGLLGAPVFYSTQLFLFNSLSLSPFSTTFPPLESAWAYCSARSRGSFSLCRFFLSSLLSYISPLLLPLLTSSFLPSFLPLSSSLFALFCPYGVQLVAYCSARSISTFLSFPFVLPCGPAWAYCPVRLWGPFFSLSLSSPAPNLIPPPPFFSPCSQPGHTVRLAAWLFSPALWPYLYPSPLSLFLPHPYLSSAIFLHVVFSYRS